MRSRPADIRLTSRR